jgi:hypothetical protein
LVSSEEVILTLKTSIYLHLLTEETEHLVLDLKTDGVTSLQQLLLGKLKKIFSKTQRLYLI